MFSASPAAPQSVENDSGERVAVGKLRAARAAAYQRLTQEERAEFVHAAAANNAERQTSQDDATTADDEADDGQVARGPPP